jgi:cephalosporin-C deacetylase-like acetyl esterase
VALAGRTVLESLRVLDWVDEHFGVAGPRVAGGVSMGGDVAVALAGVDPRIDRVAALVATPDSARPGMQTQKTMGQDHLSLISTAFVVG